MWLKEKKDQEQYKKTIIELKGTALKFHKFSITFWPKAVLQPKNKHKSAVAAQSVNLTDFEITSVLLCLIASIIKQI